MTGPNPHPPGICGYQECDCPNVVRTPWSLSKSWIWTLGLGTVLLLSETYHWWAINGLAYQVFKLDWIAFVISALITLSVTIGALLEKMPSASWLGRWRDRPAQPPQPQRDNGTTPAPSSQSPAQSPLEQLRAVALSIRRRQDAAEARRKQLPPETTAPPVPPTGAVHPGPGGPTPPTKPPAPVNIPLLPGPNAPKPVGFGEWLKNYHTSDVVSGIATLVDVAMNGISAPAWSFLTRGVAGAVTHGAIGDVADFSGLHGSGMGAAVAYAESGRALAQGFSEYFNNPLSVANRLENPLLAGFAKVQSVPVSLHAASMSFAQKAIMKIEAGRLAGAEATRQGLAGQAWKAFVANQIAQPTGEIGTAARGVADRASLKGDLGTLGDGLRKIVEKTGPLGNTLFPVLKISANSLSQKIEASPLGLFGPKGTLWDVAQAKLTKTGPYAGPEGFSPTTGAVAPLQERLTNNIAGTALTAWLLSQAASGMITGAGPADKGQREELEAQGWQRYSIWTPFGYMEYRALNRLAIPLALAGSYHDAQAYGGQGGGKTSDPGTIAGMMADQMGQYLEDQTGMRQIGQLYDIFHTHGPTLDAAGKMASSVGAGILGGYVPESAMVTTDREGP